MRSYSTVPQIWGGSPGCQHVWGAEQPKPGSEYREGLSTSIFAGREDKGEIREAFAKPRRARHVADVKNPDSKQATSAGTMYEATGGQFCQLCGAWKGELGSEPTIEGFCADLVEIFREVKRVLRSDGFLALNLGDSYAHNGACGGSSPDGARKGRETDRERQREMRLRISPGLKPKDLCMIPSRVAMALQAEGWWLRSMIPWPKRSAMPDSATDRPGSAVEYWFMLTKSPRYFYDGDAVRIAHAQASVERAQYARANEPAYKGHAIGKDRDDGGQIYACGLNALPNTLSTGGRNRRNSDWYFDGLRAILDGVSMPQLDEDGNILALPINSQGSGLEHYAGYPPAIVMPFILAGTSQEGVCSKCGAPRVRAVERGDRVVTSERGNYKSSIEKYDGVTPSLASAAGRMQQGKAYQNTTLGFRPSCSCVCCDDPDLGGAGCTNSFPETVPATVLDPFLGSGTTAVVAVKLGRNAIGCELSPKYVEMATRRIKQECGLLAEISVERIGK